MQQSGMLVFGSRCLPLDVSLGSAGSVVTARALSWLMAWVLENGQKGREREGRDTDLKALAADCHSLPTSILILTDL